MNRTIAAAGQASPEAFAPFGCFVEQPLATGERRHYGQWLGGDTAGLAAQMHVNAVAQSCLPLTVTRVERHPHAAQIFLPLQVARYLVVVMPSDAAGEPELDAAQGFIVPGNIGVIYRAGVWHIGATALERDANFAVLMWRGADNDDVFLDIPPFTVVAEASSDASHLSLARS
jgi:ureidoglycolate lyase